MGKLRNLTAQEAIDVVGGRLTFCQRANRWSDSYAGIGAGLGAIGLAQPEFLPPAAAFGVAGFAVKLYSWYRGCP